MTDRRYTHDPCEVCGDPWCAGCEEGKPDSYSHRYYEISLKELIDIAGGREAISNEEDPYTYLMQAQQDYIDGLLTFYHEVGEVNNTEICDYVDNLN